MKIFSKSALRRIGILAGALLAILLIANAIWVWRTGSRLEKKLAALRAAGEPVTLADLARGPIPPEQNAAVFLRRARNDLEAMYGELRDVYSSYPNGLPSESGLKTIRSALEAYPVVIPLLEQAAACPDYDRQTDYTAGLKTFIETYIVDGMREKHNMAGFLWARVALLISQGEQEEAIRTCITMFRLCRHFDHEPTIYGYLSSMACRGVAIDGTNLVLRSGRLSEDSRESLEAELALHDGFKHYQDALKTQRPYTLEFFCEMPWHNFWLVNRPFWTYYACDYLDAIDHEIALAERPYPEVAAMNVAPDAGGYHRPGELVVHREGMEGTRARIRCLRVLNALRVFPDQAAETPKLSELGLPAAATTDPFTGKPLHLKKLPAGWLVYSVGKDLKDDGGDFTKARDVGVGPIRPEDGK